MIGSLARDRVLAQMEGNGAKPAQARARLTPELDRRPLVKERRQDGWFELTMVPSPPSP
jgi:hypothetical protein